MNRVEKAAPILALLRKYEAPPSAAKAQGVPSSYEVVYSGISAKHRTKALLTSYPVKEIIEWQGFVVANGAASSAAGAYQIIRKTLVSLNLPGARVFDAACQDECALRLMDLRGWAKCEAGSMTPEAFGDQLAREWASMPVHTAQKGQKRWVRRGESYYAGDGLNAAHAGPDEVMTAVRAALAVPTQPPATPDLTAWLAEGRRLHTALGEWLAQAPT